MKQTALFYNFSEERLKKVKIALLPLKISVKRISKEEFSQPIGALVGIKDFALSDEKYDGDGFDDEMIIMYGFTSSKIDELIRALNKHGVGRVPLKAVVTPTNMSWNSVKLYSAVKSDHEEMNGKK